MFRRLQADDIQGVIDANVEGTLLDAALDEFIQVRNRFKNLHPSLFHIFIFSYHFPDLCFQDRHDIELSEGVKLSDIEKAAKGARFLPGDNAADLDETELAARIAQLKVDSSVLLPPEEVEDPATVAEVMKSVSYLAEEREEEQWDCETILTTYSTLDNHPSIIKDANPNKNRKKRERRPRKEAEATSSSSSVVSITEVATANPNTKIILAGKLGLPKVVVAGPPKKYPIAPIAEDIDGSDEDSEGSGCASEHSFEDREEKEVPGRRNRGETAEEKKVRKQKVHECICFENLAFTLLFVIIRTRLRTSAALIERLRSK